MNLSRSRPGVDKEPTRWPVWLLAVTAVIAVFWSASVHAKLVTADWELRLAYDKLVSCRAIPYPFYGQRTWTTGQIYKQIKHIELENLPKSYCSREVVEDLLGRFDRFMARHDRRRQSFEKIYFKPIDSAKASYFFISSGDSRFPENGRGAIDAIINSFRENRQGTVLGIGHSLSLTSEHELFWGKQDFFLMPRADVLFENEFSKVHDARVTIQQAYAVFDFWELTAIVGRAPVVWGQAEYGGQIFSENARPLDHLQITNTDPFRLPWIFKRIGTFKLTYILGNLGPESFFPWTFFTGLSIGYKPVPFLELNLHHVIQFGGDGSPDFSFLQGVQEFFGFIPYLSQTAKGGVNKLTAANMRFFIPSFMGLQGYLSYFMDDLNSGSFRAYKKHFKFNSSYQIGMFFACFTRSCLDAVRLEYTNSTQIAYRHGEFLNGWTVNGNIIGDPLGPDGNRVLLTWDRNWYQQVESRVGIVWQSREDRVYDVSPDGLDVIITFDGPAEKRLLFFGNLSYPVFDERTLLSLGAGLEWVRNYQFVPSRDKGVVSFFVGVARGF